MTSYTNFNGVTVAANPVLNTIVLTVYREGVKELELNMELGSAQSLMEAIERALDSLRAGKFN